MIIMISHIFPKNFIEVIQIVQKIWRFSLSILTVFINFSDFLVTKRPMASAYDEWCQQFLTFNLLYVGCLTIGYSYIDIRLVLLEIWIDRPPPLPPTETAALKTSNLVIIKTIVIDTVLVSLVITLNIFHIFS